MDIISQREGVKVNVVTVLLESIVVYKEGTREVAVGLRMVFIRFDESNHNYS